MARAHGKNADFVFNAVALEDELSSVSLNFEVPEAEITAFADAWGNFLAGKPTATMDVSGYADMAASQGDVTIFNALGGAALTWDFEPDGTTGYNGYANVTSYSIQSSVSGPITYSASFRHNGTAAAADGAAPTRA